ncbi:hypothetical protein J2Z83_000881 [Virgibacillus natechei]|uniref:Aminoglycoside phosphotransferase domain-containing protein n=1 Tax=Virgibacillus natechei TaxID=1216297 RepID=A0ABS4ICW7_9BACI|nr:phosphotransferase [Virgibacillus natechei]MBP1968787.1 hypothetical protein [Virgibacillus natechei]UZD11586.1 aminoglycoside phosphotransferase family protein [Virgibacillus natechei]
MNNPNLTQRDEVKDRLSSFLFKEGGLSIHDLFCINFTVFYIQTTDGEEFLLKRHNKKDSVEQQWDFFTGIGKSNVIPFQGYPNGRKIISMNNYYWTISPFIQGKKLDYNSTEDRKQVVTSLQEFHYRAQGIHLEKPLTKELLFIRWYQRLLLFKKTSSIFKENGFENLYKDIVQTTVTHLRFVTQFPWEEYERKAKNQGRWIHGDVASHNFLRNKTDKRTYLIDFDLLQCTTPLYDYIQLGQRFLPYLRWDPEKLLSFKMVQDSEIKPWLYAVFIPSDILREWLHFLYKKPVSSPSHYLSQMEKTWVKRQDFVKNAKLMLN